MNSEVVYLLHPVAPVKEVQLAVEIVGGPVSAKQYLLAVEPCDVDRHRIGAQQISWPYSTKLDTPYSYFPASQDGYVKFPSLGSQSPIWSLKIWVVPWGGLTDESSPRQVFGRLVYRYWTMPDPSASAVSIAYTGVVS